MHVIAIFLLCLFFLALGCFSAVALIVVKSRKGKAALALWNSKEKRWEVVGSYLKIAADITTKLKGSKDQAAPGVHYIE